jgi:hypothetical protein
VFDPRTSPQSTNTHPRLEFLLEVLRPLAGAAPPLWWCYCLAIAIELEHRAPEDLVAFDLLLADYAFGEICRQRRARP